MAVRRNMSSISWQMVRLGNPTGSFNRTTVHVGYKLVLSTWKFCKQEFLVFGQMRTRNWIWIVTMNLKNWNFTTVWLKIWHFNQLSKIQWIVKICIYMGIETIHKFITISLATWLQRRFSLCPMLNLQSQCLAHCFRWHLQNVRIFSFQSLLIQVTVHLPQGCY